MKYLIASLLTISTLVAVEVKVSADKFSANEIKNKAEFLGHVVITKQNDILKADKLTINFDKKRKPTKYEATGNASIKVFIKNKEYFGKGKTLTYEPKKNKYTIKGNAFFEDRTADRKVYGEIISVNQTDGKYQVDGKNNEPVKFIFQVDDKEVGSKIKW